MMELYLKAHEGWNVDVHLKPDQHDQPNYPFVIAGILHRVHREYLVIGHGGGAEYVVPLKSIKLVKIEAPAPPPAERGEE